MKKTHIKKSKIHGRGVFASESIECGDYIFMVRDTQNLTERGRFVNHQKNGNCGLINVDGQYWLMAIQDIDKDSELTSDYSILKFPFSNKTEGFVEL